MQNKSKVIQDSYTQALQNAKKNTDASCCSPTTSIESCCTPTSGSEILLSNINAEALPTDQSISFGCYRLDQILETKLASGQTVIDFGSGPGHDLFLAARKVGSNGRAIGVDFTDAMIQEATSLAKEKGLTQVELVKASIENIPLDDNTADAIISNCVINLSMDKQKVFDEAFRLLKPGGQLIDADIISGGNFTETLKKNNDLWCSCIGGALTETETIKMLQKTGFKDIEVQLGEKSSFIFENKEFESFSAIIYAKKPN